MSVLWAALAILGGLGVTAIGDMVSEEVRDRLDHVPQSILRLAARRLDPEQRATIYEEVWLPDLAYFLRGDEARPVTRLIQGARFAVGILAAVRTASFPESDSLAFERIVPRAALFDQENLQLANLNRIIHGAEKADHKTQLLASVERSIIMSRIYLDALSHVISRAETATRRQRREMLRQQDVARRTLQVFHDVREDIEVNYEARFGSDGRPAE